MSGASINSARLKKCDDTHVISFELLLDSCKQNGQQIWVLPVELNFTKLPEDSWSAHSEVMTIASTVADLMKEHLDRIIGSRRIPDDATVLEVTDHVTLAIAQTAPDWTFSWLKILEHKAAAPTGTDSHREAPPAHLPPTLRLVKTE